MIDVLTYGAGVAALAILFLALRRRTDLEADLLLFAGCAVVTLLMVYNRSYSATLLVLPLGWAFASYRPRALWLVAIVISGATAVFVVPGAAALAQLALPPDLQWISETTWWRLLQVHQIVALLTILGGLLVAARYRRADNASLYAHEAGHVLGVEDGLEQGAASSDAVPTASLERTLRVLEQAAPAAISGDVSDAWSDAAPSR